MFMFIIIFHFQVYSENIPRTFKNIPRTFQELQEHFHLFVLLLLSAVGIIIIIIIMEWMGEADGSE